MSRRPRLDKRQRMKSYLLRVMSPAALYEYRRALEDWRDCQVLQSLGFKAVGTSSKGTCFEFPAFAATVKEDTERLACLRK